MLLLEKIIFKNHVTGKGECAASPFSLGHHVAASSYRVQVTACVVLTNFVLPFRADVLLSSLSEDMLTLYKIVPQNSRVWLTWSQASCFYQNSSTKFRMLLMHKCYFCVCALICIFRILKRFPEHVSSASTSVWSGLFGTNMALLMKFAKFFIVWLWCKRSKKKFSPVIKFSFFGTFILTFQLSVFSEK